MKKKNDLNILHHIQPKRFNKNSKEVVEISPNEHRWIHILERYARNSDEALAAHITARNNKKYEA